MDMYSAHERFSPDSGEGFCQFVEWTGFKQIDEVVSADSILCPNLIDELCDEDWNHNVHADNRVFWFHDLPYLIERIGYDPAIHNILTLAKEPVDPVSMPNGFEFCGYDILDSFDSISVLTNCGGFADIFAPGIVNRFALLDDLSTASDCASRIRRQHPDDPHCHACSVWSIGRYAERE